MGARRTGNLPTCKVCDHAELLRQIIEHVVRRGRLSGQARGCPPLRGGHRDRPRVLLGARAQLARPAFDCGCRSRAAAISATWTRGGARPSQGAARKRSKAHLLFVREQPCLVCRPPPCDAHHLKFAQPRALGRKVSDEFTVPLCRAHHHELHRHGNERAWWANLQIAPPPIAQELRAANPVHDQTNAGIATAALPAQLGSGTSP